MRYEVEQKHRVDDLAAFAASLAANGVTVGPQVEQTDRYFAHPSRNFSQTDEALRIRSSGGRSFVTYKGPKLNTSTKTRRELEFPLDEQDLDGTKFSELLEALGFRPVATVRKLRRTFYLDRAGQRIEGAIDEVDGVGVYVELELQANEDDLEVAQTIVTTAAAELHLGSIERRSYLELLLSRSDSQ